MSTDRLLHAQLGGRGLSKKAVGLWDNEHQASKKDVCLRTRLTPRKSLKCDDVVKESQRVSLRKWFLA